MTEPISDQDLIDTAAALMVEELERFDRERQEYQREIEMLRRQLAVALRRLLAADRATDVNESHHEIDAADYAKVVADETDALRQRVINLEGQLAQERAKLQISNVIASPCRQQPPKSRRGSDCPTSRADRSIL